MKTIYDEMKVFELKEQSKQRGLKLEHKGHKYNKSELIERLVQYDNKAAYVVADETKNKEQEAKQNNETKETTEVFDPTRRYSYKEIIQDIREIEKRFQGNRQPWVYEDLLEKDAFVVFLSYVEPEPGMVYEKLRTAKVIGMKRDKELVKVELLSGETKILQFNQLIFIRGKNKFRYPRIIRDCLAKQRTKSGKEYINERFK